MTSVRQFYQRNRKHVLIVLSAIIGFINFLGLFSVLTINRSSNDECLWEDRRKPGKDAQIHIVKIKPGGVTDVAGIKENDRLLEINGIILTSTLHAQDILNQVPENSKVIYTIGRGDSVFYTNVRIKKLINFRDLGFGLFASIWFIISFIVIMAKPDGQVQKLFYLIGIGFSVIRITPLFLPFVGKEINSPLLINVLAIQHIAKAITAYLYIRFFAIFPMRIKFFDKKYVKVTLISICVVVAMFSLFRLYFTMVGPVTFLSYGVYLAITDQLLAISAITGFILFVINYFRTKEISSRRSYRFIILAYLLAFAGAFFVVTVAAAMGYIIFNSPEYFTPIILVAVLPIAFGYSIFRYQFMDVSYVVQNTVIYGLATVTIAIIYFLSVFGIGKAIGSAVAPEYQEFVTLFAFILFALIFQSTKERFQELITKRFYPEQFASRQILIDFTRQLVRIVGLENILNAIQNVFSKELKLKKFAIALTVDKNRCPISRSTGIKNGQLELHFHNEELKKFFQSKSFSNLVPVIDQTEFPNIFPNEYFLLEEEEIYSVLPLVFAGKTIGFFLLGLNNSGLKFSGKNLETLMAFADQSAISIENARLYKAESEKLAIERDLAVARRIQQSLLPKKIPAIKGIDIYGKMIPAMQVGGDYYDVIQNDDNSFYVLVGDVSGKGLSASLYMSKIQTLVQLECGNGKSPRQILINLNKKLYQVLEKNSFITMSMGLFDLKAGILHYTRAGHIPLLINDGGTVREIKSRGLGIGIEQGEIFEKTLVEEIIPLKKGQLFLFYSDGINEAMNEKNEPFDTQKIIESIKLSDGENCETIAGNILKNLVTFRGETEQNDDMTLVLVKV